MSIADLFVVRRKVWLEFQEHQAKGTLTGDASRGFKESRSGMRLGDFRGSEKGIGKIKETPEGQFEYTADLTFAFSNRRKAVITDKSVRLGSKKRLQSYEHRHLEDVKCENYKINHHRSNSSNSHEQREKRRKLYGSKTTSEREEMISNLRQSTVFPFTTDIFESSLDDERAIKVHELSFLDLINGVATTQHLVQVGTGTLNAKVRLCAYLSCANRNEYSDTAIPRNCPVYSFTLYCSHPSLYLTLSSVLLCTITPHDKLHLRYPALTKINLSSHVFPRCG